MARIVILGAGIAGLGAAYTCKKKEIKPLILEKDNTFGGI